jgi:hypothetical protein
VSPDSGYMGPQEWAISRQQNLRGLIENGFTESGCPEQHARKFGSSWFRGSDDEIGVRINSIGRGAFRARCRRCGQQSSDIPRRVVVDRWRIPIEHLAWFEQSDPAEYDECTVEGCTTDGVEMHHFAPRNVFGSTEADRWPYLPLCRTHHVEWHRTMDGYRWNASRGPAERCDAARREIARATVWGDA